MIDELGELLRRSHRDELLPLARAVGLNPEGLGRDRLADVLARAVRRSGGHALANLLLRRGEGPPYERVLRDLAGRHRIPVGEAPEDTELAVAQWWIERAWDQLDGPGRERVWAALEMAPPAPEEATLALAQARHDRRFGYLAGRAAVGLAAARVVPFLGCLAALYLARPRDDRLIPAVLAVHRLRRVVRHRVTVGVVGSPSSGKDAAIRAIFGIDSGNVDPVAGSTTAVEITRLQTATALYVVNTPGLGDVVEAVTEEARQVLDHIDVYLYVVNAQRGVQARERADFEACRATGRPVLAVVNKIDTLRPADRDRYLADARGKLEVSDDDFVAAAFDPLPQLADAPIGVDAARAWLERRLVALGKDPAELPWRADPATAPPGPDDARLPGRA